MSIDNTKTVMWGDMDIISPRALANLIQTNNLINQEEAVRESQEADRQANTATAITNANNATASANTATSNANTATLNANNATADANSAADNANNVAELLETETLKIYKDAVVNYSDLATTYPTPQNGWTVAVTSENVSYRWNGTAWVDLGATFGDIFADNVIYDNTTSGLTATNAQAAIDELKSETGDLANLGTSTKTNLVLAINENKNAIDGKINKNALVYNIKDFGATGNGSTDDYNNIKSAVDLLNTTGGILYIPIGNYKISHSIQITKPCIIMGTGDSSKLSPYSSITCLFDIQSTLVTIENLNLENTGGLATRAIEVTNTNDDTPIIFNNLYIALFTRGILWRDGTRCIIQNCTMVSNTLAFESLNDCRNSVFTNLYTLGGSGILLGGNDSKAEGVEIINCYLFPGNNGDVNSFAVKIVSGLAITISNCILDQIVTGSAVVIDGANTRDIHIKNCWIGANYNSTTTNYGILQIYGTGLYVSECTIVGFDQSGIYIQGASTRTNNLIYIDNCNFLNEDPNLRDIQLDYATNVIISRCRFSGTSNIVEQNNCSGVVKDCYFTNIPSRTQLKYQNQLNNTVKTTGYGTATIPATQRTVTVTHGLSYTPDISDINVVLQGFPSNNESIGSVVIDSITSSTFRIVIQTATTVSNVVFSWKAVLNQ